MKSKFTAALFILIATLDFVNAKLSVESMTPQQADRPYAQIILKDGKSFWISAEQLNANGTAATFFLLQEMNCISRGKTKKIKTPDTYMILAPLSESIRQNTLVTGVNFHGQWSVIQLSANLSSVRQAQPLIDMGFVWASATSRTGYFIAGTSVDKRPTLIYLSADLKNKKTLSQANDHNGEVSNVFESKGRIFSLFNRYLRNQDANTSPRAELREYSTTGAPVSRTPLNGMAATGMALKDGGIAISYWIGKQLFIEKRGANLSALWSTKLHQRSGVASRKGYLLETGSHIAWVGANDDKLLIHRLAQDGKSIQTSIDTKTNIGAPIPDIYSVHSSGDDIHVRGVARRSTDPSGQVTEFCFTEQPDS
ncbi:hypothetical protein [Verminephrobacter aporrectodeae]|uniref:hypothetical protein n=2 Tax=Verminephrobacter aporrectodeae TaxID=1110389 RepID=UPI002238DAE8|nr:hypothetical protein [Verminephrobacter aporrectodeae]